MGNPAFLIVTLIVLLFTGGVQEAAAAPLGYDRGNGEETTPARPTLVSGWKPFTRSEASLWVPGGAKQRYSLANRMKDEDFSPAREFAKEEKDDQPFPRAEIHFAFHEPAGPAMEDREGAESTGPPKMASLLPFALPGRFPPESEFSLLSEDQKKLPADSGAESGEVQTDWKGIRKDTAYYMGYQVVIIGILYLLPEDVTNWTTEQKKVGIQKWWENVTDPHWDTDKFWINYIAHPYWGAIFYTRGRERGLGEWGAFGYSALLSAMYEFGIEALFEQPSYQDLVVTPVGGFLIGKYLFEPIRERIKLKEERRWYDYLTLTLTDPMGAANSFFDWVFGWQAELRLQMRPPGSLKQGRNDPSADALTGEVERKHHHQALGLELHWEWN